MERQREDVSADARLDREGVLRVADHETAHARRPFEHEERALAARAGGCRGRRRSQYLSFPHHRCRCCGPTSASRRAPADRQCSGRQRRRAPAQSWLEAPPSVLWKLFSPSIDGDPRQADWKGRGLVPAVVLRGELDRLADAGALHDRLEVLHHAVAELEADVGAVVEAKQVAQLRLEAVVAQVLVEPVRESGGNVIACAGSGSVVGRLMVTKSGSRGRNLASSSSDGCAAA